MTNDDQFTVVERFLSIPRLLHATISPDGQRIAFVRDDTGRDELYVKPIPNGPSNKITDRGLASRSVQWHPEGDRLFVIDTADTISVVGVDGTVEPLITDESSYVLIDCSPDGRFLWYTNLAESTVYQYELPTDKETQISEIAAGKYFQFACHPTGEYIAYPINQTDVPTNRDIVIASTTDDETTILPIGGDTTRTLPHAWHPDGRRLLVSDGGDEIAYDQPTNGTGCGVYDWPTDEVSWIGGDSDDTRPITFLSDGNHIVAQGSWTANADRIVIYDLEGSVENHCFNGRVRFDFDAGDDIIVDDTTISMLQTTPTRPEAVYSFNIHSENKTTLLEPALGDVSREELTLPRRISIPTEANETISGLFYDSGQPSSPAICDVYGLRTELKPEFDRHHQLLAQLGYSVLVPTCPVKPFSDAEHSVIATTGKWLRSRDGIDGDRVAVYGHSRGGYNVYMQMGKYPEVWDAGIAWAGFTDLTTFDTEEAYQVLGDPAEHVSAYRSQSPISYVDNVQGPLLMIHGEDDYVPISQARQFRDALQSMGKKANDVCEYHEFSEMGHIPETIDEKIQVWKVITQFLSRHLNE